MRNHISRVTEGFNFELVENREVLIKDAVISKTLSAIVVLGSAQRDNVVTLGYAKISPKLDGCET
jgi:hypothetical protein